MSVVVDNFSGDEDEEVGCLPLLLFLLYLGCVLLTLVVLVLNLSIPTSFLYSSTNDTITTTWWSNKREKNIHNIKTHLRRVPMYFYSSPSHKSIWLCSIIGVGGGGVGQVREKMFFFLLE